MKRLLVLALLTAGCAGDDSAPDPATCPAAPFWHCGVYDNGWTVWCENGVVFADDMTANAYCFPDSNEVACMTGGTSVTQRHVCAVSCATDERRYFDYVGDFSGFDPQTLCTPP